MNSFSVYKKIFIVLFIGLGILSASVLENLKFSFDFSQFFPEEDPDLEFYQEFVSEFGTDDNFLLIAIKNDSSVFEPDFLNRFHQFSEESKTFDFVTESNAITTLSYPLKTSFGYTALPIIHRDDKKQYEKDWLKIQEDELFVNVLIDEKATSLVVALQTVDDLDYAKSEILLNQVRASLIKNTIGLRKRTKRNGRILPCINAYCRYF